MKCIKDYKDYFKKNELYDYEIFILDGKLKIYDVYFGEKSLGFGDKIFPEYFNII